MALPYGENFRQIVYNCFDTLPAFYSQTERRTDGQTDKSTSCCQHAVRDKSYAHRSYWKMTNIVSYDDTVYMC